MEAHRGSFPHEYVSSVVNTSTSTPRSLSCIARNIHGSVTSDPIVFRVVKPGTPPKDIASTVDIDNRVTITWSPPLHPNGDIKVRVK